MIHSPNDIDGERDTTAAPGIAALIPGYVASRADRGDAVSIRVTIGARKLGRSRAHNASACARSRDNWRSRVKRPPQIFPYSNSHTGYVEYDPGAIDAAARVAALIQGAAPWTEVEHIGSTAIPACAGKGIVDVMAMYPPGKLEATREAIDALGFQHQMVGHIFPEERPMRVGAIQNAGKRYRLHVHLIDMNSPEKETLRRFRDMLRADPALRDAYQAKKRAILQSGVRDPKDYTYAKREFITSVIGRH
jgi:GrpB-like predicted nucleotidyltransferase (UPF0157 family)